MDLSAGSEGLSVGRNPLDARQAAEEGHLPLRVAPRVGLYSVGYLRELRSYASGLTCGPAFVGRLEELAVADSLHSRGAAAVAGAAKGGRLLGEAGGHHRVHARLDPRRELPSRPLDADYREAEAGARNGRPGEVRHGAAGQPRYL